MLKKILVGLVVIIGGLMAYAAVRPGHMNISRELLINANVDTLFPYLNNSKMANSWMPWAESDPGLVMNYSGPAEGVGSISSWDSKGQMGTGKAEVVSSIANHSVKTQLTYTKPMNMSQMAEMTLTPSGSATMVRWQVTGEQNFICRLMSIFMDMDKMVGGEFEKGLTKLKASVEVK